MPVKFYNDLADTRTGRNRLPHWAQDAASYFFTYRLADSIPQDLIARWKRERENWICEHPEPWDSETEAEYHLKFSGELDRLMDEGHGSCLLKVAECSEICRNVFGEYEGERYVMHSWVVMPNHAHILVSLRDEFTPDKVVGGWKRRSSRKIHELRGGSGALWQKDYFDRIIRDWKHFGNVARYIRRNPAKARLKEGEYLLWESEEVKRILG